MRTISVLVFALLLAAACGPYSSSSPQGRVTLIFMQDSQAGLVFELKNKSSQSIWFNGNSEGDHVRPLAYVADMECQLEGYAGWAKSPPILADYLKIETIRVAPGETARLVVHSDFVRQFKNGVCRMELQLSDGLVVPSNNFTP